MGEIADALRRSESMRPTPQHEPRELKSRGESNRIAPRVETVDRQLIEPPIEAPAPPPVVRIRADDGAAVPAKISVQDPRSIVSQQFLRVAFRLRDQAIARNAHSILLTSAEPFEGKTTTACNLAAQLAHLDHSARVVLVDLDLHRANIARSLGIKVDRPIDAVIRGELSVADAVVETDVDGLWILGLDRPIADADKLLAHPRFKAMLGELSSSFDFVIIDTPPVLTVPDAQLIFRFVDAGLIVTRAGTTSVRMLRRALEYLPSEKLIGTILNCSNHSSDLNRYGYYGDPAPADDAPDAADPEEKPDAEV